MAWPVHDCLMIEPTESEDKGEMDRFIDSMLEIKSEIQKIEEGTYERDCNPLKVSEIYKFSFLFKEKSEKCPKIFVLLRNTNFNFFQYRNVTIDWFFVKFAKNIETYFRWPLTLSVPFSLLAGTVPTLVKKPPSRNPGVITNSGLLLPESTTNTETATCSAPALLWNPININNKHT